MTGRFIEVTENQWVNVNRIVKFELKKVVYEESDAPKGEYQIVFYLTNMVEIYAEEHTYINGHYDYPIEYEKVETEPFPSREETLIWLKEKGLI